MKVYLVRHGQTIAAAKDRHQKAITSLSMLGKKQAGVLAKRLKSVHIDFIFASPEARAKETAEIISKTLHISVEYMPELREHKKPTSIEGENHESELSKKFNELVEKHHLDPEWKYEDAESLREAWSRTQHVMDHLIKHHENQDILIIGHGIILRYFFTMALFGKSLNPKIAWVFQNCVYIHNTGISLLEYAKESGWSLIYWNDLSHIGSVEKSTY